MNFGIHFHLKNTLSPNEIVTTIRNSPVQTIFLKIEPPFFNKEKKLVFEELKLEKIEQVSYFLRDNGYQIYIEFSALQNKNLVKQYPSIAHINHLQNKSGEWVCPNQKGLLDFYLKALKRLWELTRFSGLICRF